MKHTLTTLGLSVTSYAAINIILMILQTNYCIKYFCDLMVLLIAVFVHDIVITHWVIINTTDKPPSHERRHTDSKKMVFYSYVFDMFTSVCFY